MRVGLTLKPSKAQFDPTEEVNHLDYIITLHRIKVNDDRMEASHLFFDTIDDNQSASDIFWVL